MKTITIKRLAALNKKNGGCFFDPASMRQNRETFDSFTINPSKLHPGSLAVVRKSDNFTWFFNPTTGRTEAQYNFGIGLERA